MQKLSDNPNSFPKVYHDSEPYIIVPLVIDDKRDHEAHGESLSDDPRLIIRTPWSGDTFRITGLMWRESISDRIFCIAASSSHYDNSQFTVLYWCDSVTRIPLLSYPARYYSCKCKTAAARPMSFDPAMKDCDKGVYLHTLKYQSIW